MRGVLAACAPTKGYPMKLASVLRAFLLSAAFATAATTAHAQIYVGNGDIFEYSQSDGTQLGDVTQADGSSAVSATVSDGVVYVAGSLTNPDGTVTQTINTYSTSLVPITTDLATTPSEVSPDGATADPFSIIVSGNNIYMDNPTFHNSAIDEIDATTGAVNTSFITINQQIDGVALSGNTLLVSLFESGTVAEYDATTGALINSSFIILDAAQGQGTGTGGQIAVGANGVLYVVDESEPGSSGFTVAAYNASTGALLDQNFINGYGADDAPGFATAMWVDGNNLYIEDSETATISDYNANTGAFIDQFIDQFTIGTIGAVNSPVVDPGGPFDPSNPDNPSPPGFGDGSGPGATPEPRSWALAAIVAMGFFGIYRRRARVDVLTA